MNFRMMCLVPVLVLCGSDVVNVQTKPNFSGTWKLLEYRIGDKVMPTQNPMVGGAVLNCGQQCMIAQTAESLTVSRTTPPDGAKPRDEVVFLDRRAMSNERTATWDGTTLRLSQSLGGILVVQTLALDQGKLVFETTVTQKKVAPYRLTYERSTGGS